MQLPQFNTQNRNSPIDILEPNNGTQSLNWSPPNAPAETSVASRKKLRRSFFTAMGNLFSEVSFLVCQKRCREVVSRPPHNVRPRHTMGPAFTTSG
jgi:hypothetical protein